MQTKKKLWLKNKIMQIDEANKINEIKKFFEEVKYFNQQQSTLSTNSKDYYMYIKYYKIISNKLQVLKRWNAYFYNILNQNDILRTSVSTTDSFGDNYDVTSPVYNEICSIINKLKSNTAARQIIYTQM